MLFYRHCPGCGAPARSCCARCLGSVGLDRPEEQELRRAASSMRLDGLLVVGLYGAVLKRLVLQAKNGRRRDIYGDLAPLLAALSGTAPMVATWVPPSRHRRRQRGFDHGQVLTTRVAHLVGVPCRRLLVRADAGRARQRSRQERLEGPQLVARRATQRTVLLVDDVVTTGGSLAAGARALREAGAEQVVGAVLAMVADTRPSGQGRSP